MSVYSGDLVRKSSPCRACTWGAAEAAVFYYRIGKLVRAVAQLRDRQQSSLVDWNTPARGERVHDVLKTAPSSKRARREVMLAKLRKQVVDFVFEYKILIGWENVVEG